MRRSLLFLIACTFVPTTSEAGARSPVGAAPKVRLRAPARRASRFKPRSRPRPSVRTFRIREGRNDNAFLQSARVAAHAVVGGASAPRIIIANPAGESGIGLWFEPHAGRDPAEGLTLTSRMSEVRWGATTGVSFSVAGPPNLKLRRVLLDGVRAVREENAGGTAHREAEVRRALAELDRAPPGPAVERLRARLEEWLSPRVTRDASRGVVVIERTALAGARYRLELIPDPGTIIGVRRGRVSIRGTKGAQSGFRVRAFVDRPPLQPLELPSSTGSAGSTRRSRGLGFLSYREGLLAGSPNYLHLFGRDSLVAATLAEEADQPSMDAAAVGFALDSVSRDGRVPHEQWSGDEAVHQRLVDFTRRVARGEIEPDDAALRALEQPLNVYSMIDIEYLLVPVVDRVAARAAGSPQANLSQARIDALARVAVRIAQQTAPFARRPSARALIELDPGRDAGNWRDSGVGLGGGRAPLDVNAYLAPAALDSFARLLSRPGFPRAQFLAAVQKTDARAARLFRSKGALAARARAWRTAEAAFRVDVAPARARQLVRAELARLSPAERQALGRARLWSGASVGEAAAGRTPAPELDGVSFPGVALDADGKPVPILSSDQAFHLRYGTPTRTQVIEAVTRLFQPYPVGLWTPVGLVAASPAYSGRPGDREKFAADKYHGKKAIWRWQQQMVKQGLELQLARFAGDPEVERVARRALRMLRGSERRAGRFRSSELYGWSVQGGAIEAIAFGASASDSDESNAIQLWSTAR